VNCVFKQDVGGIHQGGALYAQQGASPTFLRCRFTGNEAHAGGAMSTCLASPGFEFCSFEGNVSETTGGACEHSGGAPAYANCTFYGNSAASGEAGGCLHVSGNAVVSLHRVILSFSAVGEAVACLGDEIITLSCSDIFGNAGGDWVGCIAGQYGNNGNICADPQFCDRDSGDLRLALSSQCMPRANPACGLIGAFWSCDPAGLEEDSPAQQVVRLDCCSPNPFVRETNVEYMVDAGSGKSAVRISVYDAVGRLVRTLVAGHECAGRRAVRWDGLDANRLPCSAGTYFIELVSDKQRVCRPVMLLR
jgi:hypothetical protein